MEKNKYNMDRYKKLARQTVAEGCVLLENRNQTLPLRKGDKVAVFGRCAHYYYKSGLGSGGLVNTEYVVSILDALKSRSEVSLHEELLQKYEAWMEEHPVDEGHGWGTVPWSQAEMPISEELLESAGDADTAIVIIGRTAGEDQDNSAEEGSFLLTETEEDMIEGVCRRFERSIVLLNVGNIIDMSWVERYRPAAVMYVWQGGQEGGNGVVDVLMGNTAPSGRLTDTIAKKVADYPSDSFYGDECRNEYTEDIYAGYRYFETFDKECVLYPFGYGLSYTEFELKGIKTEVGQDSLNVTVQVQNIGQMEGKEVVQVYVGAPQGLLGKPEKVLSGFAKTEKIKPGESAVFTINCPFQYFASFDDSGITGHYCCWVLEAGEYEVYIGSDVRNAEKTAAFVMEEQILEQLEEACVPANDMKRWKQTRDSQGKRCLESENVRGKVRKQQRETLPDVEYVGDQGYLLQDVAARKISMDTFLTQLSDEELISLFYGEGMCSEKVTPGTAGAFGGVTNELREYGIPVACCADGPSGIRMDSGRTAFSLPNGTMIGSTFNVKLAEDLYEMLGAELVRNNIDTILGPGINIHRHPCNGRNFEYFSEDPILTGKMCAAQLRGLHRQGVTGTIKHFCANNQEHKRCEVDAAVSMRALREIYLRAFELAVKEGNARSVMTSYNPVNGIWAAGNYGLCTQILRKDWGYTGIVMTDWWAMANWEGEAARKENRAPMIIAQNDIYMCCPDAALEGAKDNIRECLAAGKISRSELVRNAKNILGFLMATQAMERMAAGESNVVQPAEDCANENEKEITFYRVDEAGRETKLSKKDINQENDEIRFGIAVNADGDYKMIIRAQSDLNSLAQLPVTIYVDNIYRCMRSFQGTEGKTEEKEIPLAHLIGKNHYIRIKKQSRGLDVTAIIIRRTSNARSEAKSCRLP